MYRKILVPVDGSPTSNAALAELKRIAPPGAEVRLLHVLDPLDYATGFEPPIVYQREVVPLMHRAADKLLAEARAELDGSGLAVSSAIAERTASSVAEEVIETARQWPADLIVIGTHGRRGVARLLMGSDAAEVARSSPVPVLLVRALAT